MKTIFKYQPPLDDRIEIRTHQGASLLSVQHQQGALTFWFLVDTERPIASYRYAVYGTGHPVEVPAGGMEHVATVQEPLLPLVWHIFEL